MDSLLEFVFHTFGIGDQYGVLGDVRYCFGNIETLYAPHTQVFVLGYEL